MAKTTGKTTGKKQQLGRSRTARLKKELHYIHRPQRKLRATWTSAKEDAIIRNLTEVPAVKRACHLADVSVSTYYDRRSKDPDFRRRTEEALQRGVETAEAIAWERATVGEEAPIVYQGGVTGSYRRTSDTLLIFMLKGNMPEKYKDRQELTGNVSGRIQHSHTLTLDVSRLDDQTLGKLLDARIETPALEQPIDAEYEDTVASDEALGGESDADQ